MNFTDLGLKDSLVNGLKAEGITKPSVIQQKAFKAIEEGKNIILHSQTGSGKTLAYLLPIYNRQQEEIPKGMQVIVLVPTHELCMQIVKQVDRLSKNSGVDLKAVAITGSANIMRQIDRLKIKPQIVVGTSGRILELIKKRKITAHTIQTLVIDEADKMLSRDNIEGVLAVRKCVMRDTQIVFASASINGDTVANAEVIAPNTEVIKTEEGIKMPDSIKHGYIVAEPKKKIETLRSVISALKDEKTMVFINRTSDNETAYEKLKYHKYNVCCLNGSTPKLERKNAVDAFKEGKIPVMIATDVAGRGLHIDGVKNIISLSISEEPADYLHRAGRCGRNGNEGLSILIVTDREIKLIKRYESKLGIKINKMEAKNGSVYFVGEEKKEVKNNTLDKNKDKNKKPTFKRIKK